MSSSPTTVERELLPRTTCPHCWTLFAPEDVLFISAHADLLGDPRLGSEQQQRFRPTRFDVAGNALDARGIACTSMACPRCYLPVPDALLETEPVFVSILGAPACGKSFYLATLTWELRHLLPKHFAVTFTDADPTANRILNDYEEQLFLHPGADELVPVADLIRKTETQGDLYDAVRYGSQEVIYPKPFLFSLRPRDHHPKHGDAERLARILCLYDNAGESFQPGAETTRSPVTQHLNRSHFLLFLFDPTLDPRFRALYQTTLPGDKRGGHERTSRQEVVLLEAASRIRRALGLPQNARYDRPLVVVLTKCDAWSGLLSQPLTSEPWQQAGQFSGVDIECIARCSKGMRALLQKGCPEIVQAAEEFAEEVTYVPVSALGQTPAISNRYGKPAVRPCDIRPQWVVAPMLYGLSRCMTGLVPVLKRSVNRNGLQAGVPRPAGMPSLWPPPL